MQALALLSSPVPIPPAPPPSHDNNSTMKVDRHQPSEMGAHEDRSGVLDALGHISEPLNHRHRDPEAKATDNARRLCVK